MPPAHYTFKVGSFSLLSEIISKTKVEKYESDNFEAGGFKWKLSLCPNGRKERNGHGYISLYLVSAETDTLPFGWEINVIFKLFVYDQIRDKYLTFKDANDRVARFHGMKTECGFARLLSLETFNNASYGYLIDDSCVFGAEVFVIKSTGKGECVSILNISNEIYTWKIKNFSTLDGKKYFSKEFMTGEQKWKLSICPKGHLNQKGKYLCLCISLADSKSLPPKRQLYAEYRLCIRDQIDGEHEEITDGSWFSSSAECWHYNEFLSLSDLHDPSTGYLVNDTLIVEGEIKVLSVVKSFS